MNWIKHVAPDFIVVVGLCLVVYGVWCIYPPASAILAGLMLAAVGLLVSRGN